MHPSWFYYAMHTMHTMHPSWFHLPASRLIVQIFCTLWKSARPTNRSSLQMSTYVKLFENVKSFENLVVQIQIPWRCHWIMFGLKRIVVLLRKGGLERVPTLHPTSVNFGRRRLPKRCLHGWLIFGTSSVGIFVEAWVYLSVPGPHQYLAAGKGIRWSL